jgi:hypothetical protein
MHPAAFAARDLLRLAPIALEITQLVVFGSAHINDIFERISVP